MILSMSLLKDKSRKPVARRSSNEVDAISAIATYDSVVIAVTLLARATILQCRRGMERSRTCVCTGHLGDKYAIGNRATAELQNLIPPRGEAAKLIVITKVFWALQNIGDEGQAVAAL